MNLEEIRALEELKHDLEQHNTGYARSYEDLCISAIEKIEQKNKKLQEKIELLLNDLKINSEAEKETGKSYFNTNLFAIRVKEIYEISKGDNDER